MTQKQKPKFVTDAERREAEAREKAQRRHDRKRMRKLELNPDSLNDSMKYWWSEKSSGRPSALGSET